MTSDSSKTDFARIVGHGEECMAESESDPDQLNLWAIFSTSICSFLLQRCPVFSEASTIKVVPQTLDSLWEPQEHFQWRGPRVVGGIGKEEEQKQENTFALPACQSLIQGSGQGRGNRELEIE